MKVVGFIGAYDKINLIMYIAKILTAMNKKILIIDTTSLQRAKYIVPTISPARTYITDFENIDIAVGFDNYDYIKEYLGMPQHATFNYDYIFIDIDSSEAIKNFNIDPNEKNYFVSGFDAYSIKRGLEILLDIEAPMKLTKILFSKNMTKEEATYFEYLSLGCKAIWDNEKIYFPFDQGDYSVIIENQMISKIKFKKLSELYKESLIYIVEELLENKKEIELVRKTFKQIEKGV